MTIARSVSRPESEGNVVNAIVMHFTDAALKPDPLNDQPRIDGYEKPEPRAVLRNVRSNGLVEGGDGRKIALLEVDGYGTYVAREGESIVLPGTNHVLRIRKISNQTIIVGFGDHGQEFIVR